MSARIVVCGAGIAGLTAAFRLAQRGAEVTVVEAADHVGGRMATIARDGYLLDVGALAVSRKYGQMTRLAVDAGIAGRVVDSSETVAIARGGEIHRVRSSRPLDLARTGLVSWPQKLRALPIALDLRRLAGGLDWHDVGASADFDRETVEEWVRRRAGDAIHENVIAPLMRGSVMDEPDRFAALELGYIALNFFGEGVFTFAGGLGALPRALAETVDVRLRTRVLEVLEDDLGVQVHVTDADGGTETLEADACVAALSLHDMAAVHPQLAPELREVVERTEYVQLLPVQLALTRRPSEKALYLALPRADSPDLVSIYFDHNKHSDRAPEGHGLLTAFWHNRWATEHWDRDDDWIIERTAEAVSAWVPEASSSLAFGHVTRWPHGVLLSRPGTYSRLHRIAAGRADARRIHLAGDYFGGSTTNAALCSGERAAEHVVAALGLT